MNTNKKEAVKKVLPMFKVKSGLKSGFQYNAGDSLDKVTGWFDKANDSVQSKISSWTS